MASHIEGDAPTCCKCSSIPFGKCFVLDCDHLLCDKCSNEGTSYYTVTYACRKHNRPVRILYPAFCHRESNTIIRMAEAVEFSLKGQCNYKKCRKIAIAAVKQCNHNLCFDCLTLIYEDGKSRKMDFITCPVFQCNNEFPFVFADGILGGCNIQRQPMRCVDTLYFWKRKKCVIPKGNDRLCYKQGCFYSCSCGYAVCCGCMMTYINLNHRPEYLENSLIDVIYCRNPNCTKIIIVEQILQSLAEIEHEWLYKETLLCTAYKKGYVCQTLFCKNTVTIFLKCGHYYCSGCFLFTTVIYIPMDGTCIPCRMCPCVACNYWIRDSNLSSISTAADDFLRESSRFCRISQHGQAVVSTRCCLANLCLICLTDVMQMSCVSSSFFGKEYEDVIMCNESCICGVPRRFFLQFGKERNYPPFVEKQYMEQTGSCNSPADKLESNKNNPKKMTKRTQTENAEDMDTCEIQSSDASNINTKKYNGKMAREKKSNKGRSTDGFDNTKSKTSKTSNKTKTESVEKMETEETPSSDALYKAKMNKNDKMTKGKKSNGGRSTDETESNKSNTPQTSIETKTEKVEKMDTDETQSVNELNEEKGNNNGIHSLMPVTNDVTCIRCKSEAIAELKCKHSYCCMCLNYMTCCNVKGCYETVPAKDVTDMLTRLTDNAIKENGIAVGNESETNNIPQQSTSEVQKKTTDQTSVVDMKGVRNLGMTCYANCIFQILGQTNKFKDTLANSLIEAIKKKENLPLTDNLTALLEQLSGKGSGEIVEIEVSNFLRKMVALESSFERYLQNDCGEFLMSVLEGLKSENEATTLMFENTIQTFFRCKSCVQVELGRPQISHSLLIPLSKGGSSCNSVSAGLKGLLKTEKLGKDVLPCQSCNIKGDTIEQGLVLTKLPYILIMQIGRVTSKKSFWRYAKKKDDLVKYEEEMEVPQTVEVNGKAHERIFNFSLFGVVLHSGSIDSGHYYSFVKKLHTDRWFSCNDSSVRQIEKKYIFENPNAYLLFYENKGMIRNDHRTDVCCEM